MAPRCGVRFGFGNKLVTFGTTTGSCLTVHHQKVQPALAEKVVAFDEGIETTDMNSLIERKIEGAPNEIDRMEYTVMKSIHQKNPDALLKLFGIDRNKILFEVEKYTGKKQ